MNAAFNFLVVTQLINVLVCRTKQALPSSAFTGRFLMRDLPANGRRSDTAMHQTTTTKHAEASYE